MAFAAGAAATLVSKRLIDARRNAGGTRDELEDADDGSKEDLTAVLRRAALDVAVAASGQAAERLRPQGEEADTEARPAAEAAESPTG